VFNANGTESGPEFLVSSKVVSDAGTPQPDVIGALDDGRFVIAWTDASYTGGDSSEAIHAQIFLPNGLKSGPEFLVNTTVAAAQARPSLSVLADGNVVIAWSDFSQSGGDPDFGIRAQIFTLANEPGLVLTGNAQVNTLTGGAGNDTITDWPAAIY
jgi:hypothetical protein